MPCAPILRRGEIVDNEQVVAPALIEEFDQPIVGRVRQPRRAALFDRAPSSIGGRAPLIGEIHMRQVLSELGYSAAQIHVYAEQGSIWIAGEDHPTRKAS